MKDKIKKIDAIPGLPLIVIETKGRKDESFKEFQERMKKQYGHLGETV